MVPHGRKIIYAGDLMFRLAKINLIIFGYWTPIKEWSRKSRTLYKWFIRIVHFSATIATIQCMILPFEEIIIEKDVSRALEHMQISLAIVLIYIKVRYCRKKTVLALIEESIDWANINSKKYATAAKFEMNYCKVINIAIISFSVVACSCFAYMCKIIVDNYKSTSNELQWYMWYPFNPGKYEIHLYYFEVARIILIGYLNICTQVVLTTVIIDCTAKWKVMQYKFANLHLACQERTINTDSQAYVRLNMLVKEHQLVINYINKLNDIFKHLLFFEYNISSLMIAGFLVQIIEGRNQLFNIVAVCLLCSQLLLLCYNANEVGVQSRRIGEAAYESLWYLYGKEIGQTIQLIMCRSSTPSFFTIGFLGPLTATSGVEVLKVAYTFISFMSGTRR